GLALLGIIGVALFTITHSLILAMLPLLLNGIGETGYITYGAIDMQSRLSVRLLGRVNAVFVSAQFSGMILGAVLALILVLLTSWPTALYTACCAAIVILAVGAIGAPSRDPAAPHPALQASSDAGSSGPG